MSTFIQEILNLLDRGKRKKTVKTDQYFIEVGRLGSSTLNKSGSYTPKMEPFAMRMDDLINTINNNANTYYAKGTTPVSGIGSTLTNCTGATTGNTGEVLITFDTPLLNDNYVVVVSNGTSLLGADIVNISDKTTTDFMLRNYNAASLQPQDSVIYEFVVYA
jgi:hypothetical protein